MYVTYSKDFNRPVSGRRKGVCFMEKEKIESLPVDRHLWYKGRIFLEEMKFAELPESIQNHAKRQIITCDTNDDSPDGAVMGVSNYVFPNGYSDPKRLLFILTADSTFADKYPDGKRSEEKRIAFKDLPEKIREAIMEDMLKADGDRINSQLNFSEYLSDTELKDLFTKEAQEKENAIKKDQEKVEKKKHKSRGR